MKIAAGHRLFFCAKSALDIYNHILTIDCIGIHTAFTRDIGVVGQLPMGIPHGIKEPGESGDIACQPLSKNLLLQVILHISFKRLLMSVFQIMAWYRPRFTILNKFISANSAVTKGNIS